MTFEQIVKMTQPELWSALFDYYNEHLCSFVEGDYLSIMGDIPVMLVAHLDTVHHKQVEHICKSEDGNIIMSPQGIGGDDRCGVYALMQIYKTMPDGMKPYLLFTCDEETGGNGAYSFCEDFEKGNVHPDLYEMNYLIEVDRRGLMEAVYYDCDNPEFEKTVSRLWVRYLLGNTFRYFLPCADNGMRCGESQCRVLQPTHKP